MINSHKELIKELKNFSEKFDLINDFKYIKDVDKLQEELGNSKTRVLIIGLDGINLSESDYNTILTYNFVFSDKTQYNDDAIISVETDNLFCVSALNDYLAHIQETPVEFNNIDASTESDGESSYVSLSGSFDFIIKRSASYWKIMEDYSV
jgi:hypothetical protein